jgi:hypothetical protein
MLTVYDRSMTDYLQTGLATGPRTLVILSLTLYIYDSVQQLSLKLDFALQLQPLVHSCSLRSSPLLFHLLSKVLKGGPCLRSLVIVL